MIMVADQTHQKIKSEMEKMLDSLADDINTISPHLVTFHEILVSRDLRVLGILISSKP